MQYQKSLHHFTVFYISLYQINVLLKLLKLYIILLSLMFYQKYSVHYIFNRKDSKHDLGNCK